MTNYILKMLKDAKTSNLRMVVHGGGEEPDYDGNDPEKALEAIDAVEEAELELFYLTGRMGWALIITGVAEDERIADCGHSDWVDRWMNENIPS